jgi:hypothetical protein
LLTIILHFQFSRNFRIWYRTHKIDFLNLWCKSTTKAVTRGLIPKVGPSHRCLVLLWTSMVHPTQNCVLPNTNQPQLPDNSKSCSSKYQPTPSHVIPTTRQLQVILYQLPINSQLCYLKQGSLEARISRLHNFSPLDYINSIKKIFVAPFKIG